MTVDYFIDKSAPTGDFEVIYEMSIADVEALKKNQQKIEPVSSGDSKNNSNKTNNHSTANSNKNLNVPGTSTARNRYQF